jgi:integrase/recombinase XerD
LFYDFLSENNAKSLKDIRTNSLRHFLNSELDEYSYTHKKNIYTAIKSFLLFVEENNYIGKKGDNHVFKIKKNIIKSIGKEKKTLSYLDPKSEFYTFLNGIDACTLWHKDCSTRNKLMLKILILTGIRVNELVRIKKSGIVVNETQMQIEIIGKGNKKRVTYLDDETTVSYYNSIKDLSKGEYLFESRAGKILNERYVNQLVKTVMLSTGITLKEKNGPHLLRHSCSTWLSVEGGLDIAKLQVFLAHEDIQTTRKYTHLDANVVQDISSVASKIRQKKFK